MHVRHQWIVCCMCALAFASPATAADRVWARALAGGMTEYTNRPLQGSTPVIVIAYASSTVGLRRHRPSPALDRAIDAMIRSAAGTHSVEEALVRAVIEVESGFDPAARSTAGAMGLMQLMPGTARRYGVADANDPGQNIDGGTRYLKDLLAQFKGDVRLVLAAYNAGEAAVVRYGLRVPPFPETQAYVPAVLDRYSHNLVQARADASTLRRESRSAALRSADR